MDKVYKNILSFLLVLGMVFGLTVGARAASSYSNESGKYDGTYTAKVTNLTTKQLVGEKVPIEIEGMYITVQFKEGGKRWKFSEILDRRYEKEIVVAPFGSGERFEIIYK
ncbi:MAG: hypothetical protein ACI38Q_04000 [Candidatus Bruticola sp.]